MKRRALLKLLGLAAVPLQLEPSMPTAFFLCPYGKKQVRGRTGRYCKMNDLTADISAVRNGLWEETEIDGNQAIVRVRGTEALLKSIALKFKRLSEAEAAAAMTPTRSQPKMVGGKIVFDKQKQVPVKPIGTVVKNVPARPLPKEIGSLLDLWRSIGFGLGWRIPPWLCIALAAQLVEPSRAWVQLMRLFFEQKGAFPVNAVIDNFNRANETPLSGGGAWAGPLAAGDSTLQLLTNQATSSIAATWGGSYRGSSFGPDSEVFVTVATEGAATDGLGLMVRSVNTGTGTHDSYITISLKLGGGDTHEIYRMDDTAQTQLGATIFQEYTNGDGLGIEMIGSTIALEHRVSGTWTSLGTRTDTTYTAAGQIGMFCLGTVYRLDDFGGGTIASAVSGAIFKRHYDLMRN